MIKCYDYEECEYNGQPDCALPDGAQCPHGVPTVPPVTNADKIRAMSDEELADIFLRAENDRLRRERDAAVEDLNAIIGDIEEIRRGYGVDNGDADSAFADLCGNYCANKSHRCYVEAEKYRCNNFKWRGPKEE